MVLAIAGLPTATRALVSVKQFGAKGDGVTDDTAALTAALAADPGSLYFPPGVYLTGPFTVSKQVDLVGAGRLESFIKLRNGANANLMTVATAALPKIRHLQFDGNRANNTSGHLVHFPAGTGYQGGADFDSCTFRNAPQNGINVETSRNNGRIVDCFFGPANDTNVFMGGTDWMIHGSILGDSATNIRATATASALSIAHCFVFRGSEYNINIEDGHYAWIRGCSIDSGGKVGLRLAALGSTTPRQHLVQGNIFFHHSTSAPGTYSAIVCEQVDGPVISGNSFFHYPSNAVPKYLVECKSSPTNITFAGNTYTAGDYTTAVTNSAAAFAIMHNRGPAAVLNAQSATQLGTLTRKIEVFDGSGASLGFVPVYGTIS